METSKDLVRANLFLRIINYQIENPGCTVQEACDAIGVPVRTFYSWVAKDADAMTATKDMLNEAQRGSLFDFSQHVYSGLKMLIDDFTNPGIKPETRMKLAKFLMPVFEEYAKIHHASPGGEDRAPFLRTGPVLEHAQSRLATLDIAVNEDGVRIDVLQDTPIIDAVVRDSQQPEQQAENPTQLES